MKTVLRFSIIIILFSCNKDEAPQEQTKNDCIGEYTTEEIQDTFVSAFFGLDNALPSLLLCNQQVGLIDGMPVNFKFPLDVSSLSETDFEVLDSLGNKHTPICIFGSS